LNRNQQRTGRKLEEAAEEHLESCGWKRDPETSSVGTTRWVHPMVKNTAISFPTWDALAETRANPHIKWSA